MFFTNLNLFRSPSSHGSRRRIVFLAVAFIMFLIAAGGVPDTRAAITMQSGSIKGKVVANTPDRRKLLPGVVVQLRGGPLADKTLQAVSDEEGEYAIAGLVAGDYVLSVELQGFQKYEQKVSVQIEATFELNVLLQPVALS